MRFCDKCGKPMIEGYVIDDGASYYCSKACLLEDMTEEEYNALYTQGVAYWTEWEENDE